MSAGDLYGLGALRNELDRLSMTDCRHDDLRASCWRMAGLVNGGHLDHGYAERAIREVVAHVRPAKAGEVRSLFASALRKAPPRHPRVDVTEGFRFWDRVERQAAAWSWLNVRVMDDRNVTAGGAVGANALAVLVYFALVLGRSGSDLASESLRQIAKGAGMHHDAVARSRTLWARHVMRVWRGERSADPDEPNTASVYRLIGCDDLTDAMTDSRQPEGLTPTLAGMSQIRHRPWIDLNDPWHLPTADRWAGRQGRRAEWRIWLALDPDQPLTVPDLIATTGIYRQGVYETLKRMQPPTTTEIIAVGDGTYLRSLTESIYDHASTRATAHFRYLAPLVRAHALDLLALRSEVAS